MSRQRSTRGALPTRLNEKSYHWTIRFMDEAALHDLLSGRRRGIAAELLRGTLAFAGQGYSAVMKVRNFAYDQQWLAIERAPVPVISLGNITTGGTGKTPMAAWLANWLIDQGFRPGLLSRGYHSLAKPSSLISSPERGAVRPQVPINPPPSIPLGVSPQPANDEKMVLDRLCPGVPHIQQRDRVQSARQLATEAHCNVLILDDGFQHRRLFRDLDLVLIDALQPWGYGHVLPRGLLRESKQGIKRADVIIITRCDQCSDSERSRLKDEIASLRGTSDCVEIAFTPQRLLGLDGTTQPVNNLTDRNAFAFCGIGNPNGFHKTLASLGIATDPRVFPDHHHYQPAELDTLCTAAHAASAKFALTTLKDLVKIPLESWTGPPLFAIEIGVEFKSGGDLLINRIKSTLAAGPA